MTICIYLLLLLLELRYFHYFLGKQAVFVRISDCTKKIQELIQPIAQNITSCCAYTGRAVLYCTVLDYTYRHSHVCSFLLNKQNEFGIAPNILNLVNVGWNCLPSYSHSEFKISGMITIYINK